MPSLPRSSGGNWERIESEEGSGRPHRELLLAGGNWERIESYFDALNDFIPLLAAEEATGKELKVLTWEYAVLFLGIWLRQLGKN